MLARRRRAVAAVRRHRPARRPAATGRRSLGPGRQRAHGARHPDLQQAAAARQLLGRLAAAQPAEQRHGRAVAASGGGGGGARGARPARAGGAQPRPAPGLDGRAAERRRLDAHLRAAGEDQRDDLDVQQALDGRAVDVRDDVAGTQARLARRATRLHRLIDTRTAQPCIR